MDLRLQLPLQIKHTLILYSRLTCFAGALGMGHGNVITINRIQLKHLVTSCKWETLGCESDAGEMRGVRM
jgi:hypothetical protein